MGSERKVTNWLKVFAIITLTCSGFLLVQSRSAQAQVDEGAIVGTVTDSTGAVVPNAQVTLLNTDQGMTLETRTNASGYYAINPVRIGHYTVTVLAQGFSKTTQVNLTVQVAQTLLVNVTLKVGQATETVEVNTAPPVLQTEEASVGQVIGREEVNNLPLNGRNFTFLAQLGAGMQTPQADTRGNAASGAFSANGLRPAQNNYLLDGIDNNSDNVDFLNGTNYVILPPVDAIQEFKVQTADFSAELGRAAGAVMNATIKSGTNSLHGTVWEFFRNDKLDAADFFEDNFADPALRHKGELRLNQFGASVGGPIIKNKFFFFGDYEGKRRVQGTSFTSNVPTDLERSSGYTNLTDILTQQSGAARTDILGRSIQRAAELDPATTRFVASGAVDPVSGLVNSSGSDGYVRDPFSSVCGPATKTFSTAACADLNMIPANRVDSNAVALLNLYPQQNAGLGVYQDSPGLYEHSNTFDTREDFNPNEKNQIFARFSYADDPQFIPGPFAGVADGGAFQQGVQTAKSAQMVAAYTYVFNANTINQARGGFAHLHTTRYGPVATEMGIPAKYGIANIPQVAENGGLPNFYIGNLTNLGSNNFLPSDEATATLQVTDDFTRIYGKHSFKMGVEYQHVKFSTLQPAWSRGAFNYNTNFTDIPNQGSTNGGIAQMILPPAAAPATINGKANPNGFSYSGGSNGTYASNINKTYDEKIYFASYLEDDWKMSPKLTVNLGLRWDYFGPINEQNGGQANFVPYPITSRGLGAPTFIVPASGKDGRTLSTDSTCSGVGCRGLVNLLPADGITLDVTDRYGQGLAEVQKTNFAPRLGMAYQITRKWVARGGFGVFFNGFENQGYGPNIGENYPFVYNLSYFQATNPALPSVASQVVPVSYNTPFAGCSTAGAGGTLTFESGFSCIPLSPAAVNAVGLGLQGLRFDYQTPRTYEGNATLQYSITRSMSATAAYVYTHAAALQSLVGYQHVTQLLPAGIATGIGCTYGSFTSADPTGKKSCYPFPDFGGGSYADNIGQSSYHGLQTKLEEQYANGITFLLTYTWSKAMSDAGDQLNGGSTGGWRAYAIPGLGPKFDYGLADYDIRNVVHFSGGYELPFGKGKKYMNQGGALNAVLGGWAMNWIATLQGGQPLNFTCTSGTESGEGQCNDILVGSPHLGIKLQTAGGGHYPFWVGNPAAFTQACLMGGTPDALTPIPGSALNCVAKNGADALGSKPGQIPGPGVKRLDYSLFKNFPLGHSDRYSIQFRSEFFNILNHPTFNAPNFSGNGVNGVGGSGDYTSPAFGAIGATRFAPFDPRQIQFAMKFYY